MEPCLPELVGGCGSNSSRTAQAVQFNGSMLTSPCTPLTAAHDSSFQSKRAGAGGRLPLQFESLRQHSPVRSIGAGRIQAAADLLSDEVRDLKGAGSRQGRRVAVH